jgi:hypothetical protein
MPIGIVIDITIGIGNPHNVSTFEKRTRSAQSAELTLWFFKRTSQLEKLDTTTAEPVIR